MGHLSVTAPLGTMPAGVDPARDSLNRLQQLVDAIDSTLRLPNSPRAFAVYLLGLFIVFIGAFLHVLVAAQIMQAEFTLAQLQEEYRAIEQQNGDIIFQIARDSNMARLHQEIVRAGYVPVKDREYIFVPPTFASGEPGDTADTVAATDDPALLAATPATMDAAQKAAIVAATQPDLAATNTRTNTSSGQWARWEDFWRNTLGLTARELAESQTASTSAITASTATSLSSATPNFWAVWWEQASEQGAKLLEQIRGQ
jgi:hypothetical protein